MYHRGLDGLRGAAALLVVGYHARLVGFSGGFLGVEIFFLLSGYLTARALAARHGRLTVVDAAGLARRRLMRLWPLLVTVVLSVAAIGALIGQSVATSREILSVFAGLSNVTMAAWGGHGALGHTWSLATEIQFYVAMLGLCLLFAKAPQPVVARRFLAIWVVLTVARFIYAPVAGWTELAYHPAFRGSGLFLGAAIAFSGGSRRALPGWVVALALGVLALAVVPTRVWDTWRLALAVPMVELAAAALVMGVIGASAWSRWHRVLASPVAVRLGELSFGLYLWHFPIAYWIRDVLPPIATFGVSLSAALALSAVTFRHVEARAVPGVMRPAT